MRSPIAPVGRFAVRHGRLTANPTGWSGHTQSCNNATEPRLLPRSACARAFNRALAGANLIIRLWATGHHCGRRIGLRRTAGFASGARWRGDSHPAAAPPHRSGHNAIFNTGGGHLRVGEYRCLRCCAGWGISAGGRRGTIRRSVATRRLAAAPSGARATAMTSRRSTSGAGRPEAAACPVSSTRRSSPKNAPVSSRASVTPSA